MLSWKTYSKSFSECIDTLINFVLDRPKKGEPVSCKGLIVTGRNLNRYRKLLLFDSLLYPLFWFVAKLDALLFWTKGYMLIAKAKVNKNPPGDFIENGYF
jgi:hypothetical protein